MPLHIGIWWHFSQEIPKFQSFLFNSECFFSHNQGLFFFFWTDKIFSWFRGQAVRRKLSFGSQKRASGFKNIRSVTYIVQALNAAALLSPKSTLKLRHPTSPVKYPLKCHGLYHLWRIHIFIEFAEPDSSFTHISRENKSFFRRFLFFSTMVCPKPASPFLAEH